jgi:hypothetical protein
MQAIWQAIGRAAEVRMGMHHGYLVADLDWPTRENVGPGDAPLRRPWG